MPEWMKRINAGFRDGLFERGKIANMQIMHDDDCLDPAKCSCRPIIKLERSDGAAYECDASGVWKLTI